MKRLSLVLTLAALALPQVGQATTWARTYGGSGTEAGFCVQITTDSNCIVSGLKDDILWLLKVDTSGITLWQKAYGFDNRTQGRWIEETKDGGYIVASVSPSLVKVNNQGDTSWSRNYGIYSYCVHPTSDNGYVVTGGTNGYGYDEKLIVVKTNSDGDTIWTKTYAESGNNKNVGYFIQRTNDEGYIITGLTGYADEYVDLSNLWLVKLDTNGNKMWSKIYENSDMSTGYCVKQTMDGGYVVTGYGNGLWLLKTNVAGDTFWTKNYSTPYGGVGNSVQETQDGGYILVGATENPTLYAKASYRSLWLLKTNPLGDTSWSRIYGGDGYDLGKCVLQTTDRGYLITGYTTSYGVGGSSDLWLLKTDSLGLLSIAEEPVLDMNWDITTSVGSRIILEYHNLPQGFDAMVFDATGRKVDNINSRANSGSVLWGDGYPSGVYFIKENKNQSGHTERVVLIR